MRGLSLLFVFLVGFVLLSNVSFGQVDITPLLTDETTEAILGDFSRRLMSSVGLLLKNNNRKIKINIEDSKEYYVDDGQIDEFKIAYSYVDESGKLINASVYIKTSECPAEDEDFVDDFKILSLFVSRSILNKIDEDAYKKFLVERLAKIVKEDVAFKGFTFKLNKIEAGIIEQGVLIIPTVEVDVYHNKKIFRKVLIDLFPFSLNQDSYKDLDSTISDALRVALGINSRTPSGGEGWGRQKEQFAQQSLLQKFLDWLWF